jgi:hypothetical protein
MLVAAFPCGISVELVRKETVVAATSINPVHFPDDRIPQVLRDEAGRCAGSWKSDVWTPRLTTQEELQEPIVKELMGRFHEKPVMHRKQW